MRDDLTDEQARAVLDREGLTIANRLKFAPQMFEVTVAPGRDFLQASIDLSEKPEFQFAEPQLIEHIPGRFTPTDPDYTDQWHLNNTGQGGGTAGADISAEEAWEMTRGAGIRLALVDNGIEVGHDDLSAAVAATSGAFSLDGMGNAIFTQGTAGFPNGNHGTFCAGMAAARANNGENGCGVANQADLVAVACLGDQVGTQATLARAIAYAADPSQEVGGANPADGADVISCSLGPNGADWDMTAVMQTALDFAVTNGRGGLGTPIFWAVTNGNFQIQFDEVCSYANVIAVGRSTRNDLEDNCGFGPELQFLATGVDVSSTEQGNGFGASTGTSFAAPVAAGVGALVLSVNGNLTWQQVRQTMRDTCDKIGGVVYDANGHNDDYGFGRINAAAAVGAAGVLITLDTSSVTFNDVPELETTARAVVFTVIGSQAATFQVVSGPSVTSGPGSFGTLPSSTSSLAAAGSIQTRQARLWLSFTGTSAGDVALGEVTVQHVESGQQWVVPISANTIDRPTVAVALALDQSGSMLSPSGLSGFANRGQVLKFAAPVFVNVLQEHNGLGIVSFDQDAYTNMAIATAGAPTAFDPTRATALGVIGAYAPNPAGSTAIGDAVEAAHNILTPAAGFDERAMVVFTDGFETDSKYIADVAGLIDDRVFAIGLGTADQIQPAALTALTNGSGGYLLLTGAVGPEDLFLLSKYYLQILAGVTNMDVVLDPEGSIKPGQKHRIPFNLNEADIAATVILLGQTDLPVIEFAVETPDGHLIDPGTAGALAGVDYITASGVHYYRMTLPVPIGPAGARAGQWHAVLTVNPQYYKRYLATLDNQPALYQQVKAHGVSYSLNVQSYSGIRLQAQMLQTSMEPGATLTVRGVLTEYGLPIGGDRAQVRAEYERPDGTSGVLTMTEADPDSGIYTASLPAPLPGVYRFRILAHGKSLRARPFDREHLLTGAVWRGGDQPPPTSTTDPGTNHEQICRLLSCLFGERVLTPEFEKYLAGHGVNLKALRECLKRWCAQRPRPGVLTPGVRPPTAVANPAVVSPDDTTITSLPASTVALIQQLARELNQAQ